ncbi:uncharacterized protein N7479_010386 [Penicillium vulpinum]|uniref:Uncharacterized protein n=1 Tax=Penicillium vulpinum TaxID=29845 RepID=A0A1V6S9D1_9EURO|nr:uncharacterized protein N7479_010386 [Penicillium vulpinum]KAJ5951973.1 hypothetical protein N7479_010386 [Penicillium vulpinum]OQE10476.1 hypothetical protein PENVUL_c004G00621 [Penicillium vulpinum]
MAWSSSHNHMDFSSPPQQYQSIDEDPTFFNGESATQPPIATVAELFSTEYSFWGSLLQHDSTLLYPDFPFPSTMGPLNSGYMDQGAMPDFSTTWNSTIEDPAADSHHLAENTVRGPPLEPTSIAQQPTPRKVGKIPTTRGNRPRRANKKE